MFLFRSKAKPKDGAKRGVDAAAKKRKRKLWLAKEPIERVVEVGHRRYVGGRNADVWYGMGKRQYHFLVARGLQPEHKFLDIACGSLRLGQFLIPFLRKGNYYGLEGEQSLIDSGLQQEMLYGVADLKKPHFTANYDFDFSFIDDFDYAIAQSLFSHLTEADIRKCFRNLRPKAKSGSRFYFTFFEGDSAQNTVAKSHANMSWYYSKEEMERFATENGWKFEYIGDWNHPRKQMMALAYVAEGGK